MLTLRPHHLIDIVRNIGQSRPVTPHPYGHAQHIITRKIIDNRDELIFFKIGADDICTPCQHLGVDGNCDDILPQFSHRVLKQVYNDELDQVIVKFLKINDGMVMSVSEFIELIEDNLEDLIPICTHPGETFDSRREGLLKGIRQLRRI